MIKSNQTSVIAADVESQGATPWYKNPRVILVVILVILVLTLCIALPFIIKSNAPTVEDPKHVAATKIQNLARMRAQQTNYSATQIQSLARTRAQQKNYSVAQASATKIQSVARMQTPKKERATKIESATKIQREVRARKSAEAANTAANMAANGAKAAANSADAVQPSELWFQPKKTARRNAAAAAAPILSKKCRALKKRILAVGKLLAELTEPIDEDLTTEQRAYMDKLLQHVASGGFGRKAERKWENHSATKIQSLARTRAQQKNYNVAQASATKIQSVARMQTPKKERATKVQSATKIQREVRARTTRQEAAEGFQQSKGDTTTKAQAVANRSKAAKAQAVLDAVIEEEQREANAFHALYESDSDDSDDSVVAETDASATKIQSQVRARAARQESRKQAAAATTIQANVRGYATCEHREQADRKAAALWYATHGLTSRDQADRKAAATMIQANVRAYNNANAKIQSLARLSPDSLSGHPIIEQPHQNLRGLKIGDVVSILQTSEEGKIVEMSQSAMSFKVNLDAGRTEWYKLDDIEIDIEKTLQAKRATADARSEEIRQLMQKAVLAANEGAARHAVATKLQSLARMKKPQKDYSDAKASATKIQSQGRARAARKETGDRRAALEETAATMIQANIRAHATRANAEAEAKPAASKSLRPSYGGFASWTEAADSKRKTTTV